MAELIYLSEKLSQGFYVPIIDRVDYFLNRLDDEGNQKYEHKVKDLSKKLQKKGINFSNNERSDLFAYLFREIDIPGPIRVACEKLAKNLVKHHSFKTNDKTNKLTQHLIEDNISLILSVYREVLNQNQNLNNYDSKEIFSVVKRYVIWIIRSSKSNKPSLSLCDKSTHQSSKPESVKLPLSATSTWGLLPEEAIIIRYATQKYIYNPDKMSDLISECLMVLQEAKINYDLSLNSSFLYYAKGILDKRIIDYNRNNDGLIRIPHDAATSSRRLQAIKHELESNGQPATVEAIAATYNKSIDKERISSIHVRAFLDKPTNNTIDLHINTELLKRIVNEHEKKLLQPDPIKIAEEYNFRRKLNHIDADKVRKKINIPIVNPSTESGDNTDEMGEDESFPLQPKNDSPEEIIIFENLEKKVFQILEGVQWHHKMIFVLRVRYDVPACQLADQFDCTPQNIAMIVRNVSQMLCNHPDFCDLNM